MPALVSSIFACIISTFLRHFFGRKYCIVSWDLRNRRFLSYLEHSISWFKDPVVFWTELLMCWITYKQKQNIMITNSYQWLLTCHAFYLHCETRLDKCAHASKEQKAKGWVKEWALRSEARSGEMQWEKEDLLIFEFNFHFGLRLMAEKCFLDLCS